MRRQCPATKKDGNRCSGSVPKGKYHCWFHDPANSDKRKRAASKGGKGNRSKLSKDLHALLDDLTSQVVSGELEPYPASVAGQLVGVRLRLLEYERRVRETEELARELEDLRELVERDSGERQALWGG